MRQIGSVVLFFMSTLVAVAACSSDETGEANASDLTDDDLARKALQIMGAAKTPPEPGEQPSCGFTGCHSINPLTLKQWREQYKDLQDVLESDRSKKEKINAFRQNPSDERTNFAPERIGIMTAGVHLGLGANVSQKRHPLTYKQGKLLQGLFDEDKALYEDFRKQMLMPVLPDYPRLTPAQYEVVLTWFKKGLPELSKILPEDRPTSCTDDFTALRARVIKNKNKTWAAQNKLNEVPMFACPPDAANPTSCFQQKLNDKDVFASAADTDFAKGWALDSSTVRVLRELTWPNSFWLRSSADGRFLATGGGSVGGAQAVDLEATLKGGKRDIGLEASFDPDFFPDNKAFMFQSGTKFCAQSLLENPATTKVTFAEPECSNLSTASGLYQTVGQQLGDNSISDRFILFSTWAGDSGSYSASARDTQPRAGEDSGIKIYVAAAAGNDVAEGYKIVGNANEIKTPWRGDTMMARSGTMIGSRIAGREGSLGYEIEALDSQVQDGQYKFTLSSLGQICMKGNKANFSFDERFLTTHHYNEPSDYAQGEDPGYAQDGSADIFVVDFVTGKKQKITKMGPGQFALYPHFRSDGWLYFLVVDHKTRKFYLAASDWAVRQGEIPEASP